MTAEKQNIFSHLGMSKRSQLFLSAVNFATLWDTLCQQISKTTWGPKNRYRFRREQFIVLCRSNRTPWRTEKALTKNGTRVISFAWQERQESLGHQLVWKVAFLPGTAAFNWDVWTGLLSCTKTKVLWASYSQWKFWDSSIFSAYRPDDLLRTMNGLRLLKGKNGRYISSCC